MKKILLLATIATIAMMTNISFAVEQSMGEAPKNTVCMQNKDKAIVCKEAKSANYSKVTGSNLGKSTSDTKLPFVYKYKNKEGNTVYSDSKAPSIKAQVLDLNSKEMNDKISSY